MIVYFQIQECWQSADYWYRAGQESLSTSLPSEQQCVSSLPTFNFQSDHYAFTSFIKSLNLHYCSWNFSWLVLKRFKVWNLGNYIWKRRKIKFRFSNLTFSSQKGEIFLCYRCIKAALLPNIKNASWTTKATTELKHPKFCEEFRVSIAEQLLINKTLQVQIWSLPYQECLVSTIH